eukprot:10242518-Ditylum_brightwellii.AAC.1
MFTWLKLNGIFLCLSTLRSTKEMALKIGEMTQINPHTIHRVPYQEYINGIPDEIVDKKQE